MVMLELDIFLIDQVMLWMNGSQLVEWVMVQGWLLKMVLVIGFVEKIEGVVVQLFKLVKLFGQEELYLFLIGMLKVG